MSKKILHINGEPITKISLNKLCHYMERITDLATIDFDMVKQEEYRIAKKHLATYLKDIDSTNTICKVLQMK